MRIMTFRSLLALSTIGPIVLTACSSESADVGAINGRTASVQVERHGSASEAQPFSETVVHLEPDGSAKVDVYYRSASAARATSVAMTTGGVPASNGMRIDEPAFKFSPCFRAQLNLWDQPAGGGNSICFFGRNGVGRSYYLSSFPRGGAGDWAGKVASFSTSDVGPDGFGQVVFSTMWTVELGPPSFHIAVDSGPPLGAGPVPGSQCAGGSLDLFTTLGQVVPADACVQSAVAVSVFGE